MDLDKSFFQHFVTADQKLSHWYEDIKHSRNLLICIGDSWTWGDSLGNTSHCEGISDPARLDLVYGRHLQNMITNCDWINIGYPGTGNQWIVDVAKRFVNISQQVKYDQIIMSIGLTDITRDIRQDFFSDPNISLRDYLVQIENNLLKTIKDIQEKTEILVLVGRNFTNTFLPENESTCDKLLPLRWVDISADRCSMLRPPSCIGYSIPDKLPLEDKKWVLRDVIPGSRAMHDYLMASPLHYKKATKHPNELCHRYWAEYIFQYIKEVQNLTVSGH